MKRHQKRCRIHTSCQEKEESYARKRALMYVVAPSFYLLRVLRHAIVVGIVPSSPARASAQNPSFIHYSRDLCPSLCFNFYASSPQLHIFSVVPMSLGISCFPASRISLAAGHEAQRTDYIRNYQWAMKLIQSVLQIRPTSGTVVLEFGTPYPSPG